MFKMGNASSSAKLARAIIQQAVKDLVAKSPSDAGFPEAGKEATQQARRWILEDEEDGPGSYKWCCKTLEFEPEGLRLLVKERNRSQLEKIAKIPLH